MTSLRGFDNETQGELFKAETTWFHVFKAMVDSNELAQMSGSSVKIYLVIKSHTNFTTGRSFPSIELIAEKAGLSLAQVKREIRALEALGYITKSKKGRCNLYTLRERIPITDEHGRPAAVATWDYLPGSVRDAVADLKNVIVTGDLAGTKVIHIEHLNIQINTGTGTAIQINGADLSKAMSVLPTGMQDFLNRQRMAKRDVTN